MRLVCENNVLRFTENPASTSGAKPPYAYDFSTEAKVENWEIVSHTGNDYQITATVELPAGNFVALIPAKPILGYRRVLPSKMSINGKAYVLDTEAENAYVWNGSVRFGVRFATPGGKVKFTLDFYSEEKSPFDYLEFHLIPDQEPVAAEKAVRKFLPLTTELPELPENSLPDLSDFKSGVDSGKCAGRFGFNKGDGLLDCAVPYLGMVDKMFICGHPRYLKPFRWTFSTFPADLPLHGNFPPAQIHPKNDKLTVNGVSVSWQADLGEGKFFRNTYSICAAGVIHESNAGEMALRKLEYAGNYRYILIPRAAGAEVRDIDSAGELEMTENFLLFFGATEYPDVPLMVSFDRPVRQLRIVRDPVTNRLSEIHFPGVSRLTTVTPFGCELLDPLESDSDRLGDALSRCRFWSRVMLALPTGVKEFYRLDEAAKKVEIVNEFSYTYYTDAWGTKPLEIAPFPPVLSHCGTAEFTGGNCKFITKYGKFFAANGRVARYTIPMMEVERPIALRTKGDDQIVKLLDTDFDQYLDFVEHFPDDVQSGPFFGSLFDPWAFASVLFPFVSRERQERMIAKIRERLEIAADRDSNFRYPVVDFLYVLRGKLQDDELIKMYESPDMKYLRLWNYYPRTEPYTGIKYMLCYINLCLFNVEKVIKYGTREEIAALDFPLIENDWGIGCSFYYLYLCLLACGDHRALARNWETFRSIYRFFECFHDWACMGSGYAEDSNAWVEGASLGGITGFVLFAEMLKDKEAHDLGVYLAAKHLALRCSLARASNTYCRELYGTGEWYFLKMYLAEANPAYDFGRLPQLVENKCNDGIYNFTTEGIYPEFFLNLHRQLGAEFDRGMEVVREVFERNTHLPRFVVQKNERNWTLVQMYCSILLHEALNPEYPAEKVLEHLEYAKQNYFIFRKYRGMHNLSRRLPENYFESLIRSLVAMRRHALWLLHWENCRVVTAEFDENARQAELEIETTGGKIRFGVRGTPRAATLAGTPVAWQEVTPGKIEFYPEKSGKLIIQF